MIHPYLLAVLWLGTLVTLVAGALEWRRIVSLDRRAQADFERWYHELPEEVETDFDALEQHCQTVAVDVKRQASTLLNNSESVIKSVDDIKARLTPTKEPA